MLIIPALYLSQGQCVSHYKGEARQKTILSRDPLASARNFKKQGATRIHLVDLDATDGGNQANLNIAKLIANTTDLFVQYAEGVSSHKILEDLFSSGIAYVCLNQFSENLLAQALARFGSEKIFFTIRAERDLVLGMQRLSVVDYARDLVEKGVTQIIFRDMKTEGTMHPNFDEIERLILGTPAKIFSFGGVGSRPDLEILERTGASGVLISRAFFEGRLSVRECVERFERRGDSSYR